MTTLSLVNTDYVSKIIDKVGINNDYITVKLRDIIDKPNTFLVFTNQVGNELFTLTYNGAFSLPDNILNLLFQMKLSN